MENENVFKLRRALRLERRVVGVHFLAYRQEYDTSLHEPMQGKRSFCGMVHLASNGEKIKVNGKNFACLGGAQSLGILDEPEATMSGRLYRECGLYGSHAIARQVNDSMQHIKHKIYGVEVGPLEEMEKADTVIILGSARQMMRIMQGYSNKFGVARHLSTVGNQAMCSDLVAKPFSNNDINLSLMCVGAHGNTRCSDGEMGIGFPIQYMHPLTDGVLLTLNLVEYNEEKKRILEGLDDPMGLGMPIEMNVSYGQNAARYREYCNEMEMKEGEYQR